jgi:hypothetical protein
MLTYTERARSAPCNGRHRAPQSLLVLSEERLRHTYSPTSVNLQDIVYACVLCAHPTSHHNNIITSHHTTKPDPSYHIAYVHIASNRLRTALASPEYEGIIMVVCFRIHVRVPRGPIANICDIHWLRSTIQRARIWSLHGDACDAFCAAAHNV